MGGFPVNAGNSGGGIGEGTVRPVIGTVTQLPKATQNAGTIVAVNVLDHQVSGTIGAGSATADTAAFAAARDTAVGYATAGFAVTVEIPAGSFQLNTSGVFSNIASTSVPGFVWQGKGKRATFIKLVPSGGALWFYDNGGTQRTLFPQFRDICFQGDGSTNSNGFKFTSTGNEQGARFFECQFGDAGGLGFGGTLFDLEGTLGNDSHKFEFCRVLDCSGDIFLCNNPQAVTIEFHGTNLELGTGNIFHIGTGGGGDIHVIGGDCLMDGAVASAPQTYFLQVDESANTGKSNGAVHFHDMRMEIRSPTCSLVNAPVVSNSGEMEIIFSDCLFSVNNGNGLNGASAGAGRTAVIVSNKRVVIFRNCSIPAEFNYTLNAVASSAPANGVAGHIAFEACGFQPATGALTDDVSARFTFTNGYGTARADRCYFNNNPSQRYALDFDLGTTVTANGDVTARRKIAQMFPVIQTWPGNTGVSEKTIVLPKGCKITGVYLSKPGTSGAAQAQTILMGSNDKTLTYGTVSGNQNTLLAFATSPPASTAPSFQDTATDGSDPNMRTVRLWSTGASLNNQANIGGYAFVEYI